jgi:hypothetical protein
MSSDLPKILYKDCKIGDFIFQANCCAAFEIVRAGDVIREPIAQPDAGVMQCYWTSPRYPEKAGRIKEGEITIDYFEHEFYGPHTKEEINDFIRQFDTSATLEKIFTKEDTKDLMKKFNTL